MKPKNTNQILRLKPVAMIAYSYDEKEVIYPCSKILPDGDNKLEISPNLVSSSCISLFDSFFQYIPEESKEEFEQLFIDAFSYGFKNREQYMSIINPEDMIDENKIKKS